MLQLGEIEVLPVYDGTARLPAAPKYWQYSDGEGKGANDDDWAAHRAFLDERGRIEIALGGYLVRTADRLVLVDAGFGTEAGPYDMGGGELLDSLGAHSVSADAITDVLFTHLHFDHIGWASDAGKIVFPNATYRCHRLDWDHFFGDDDFVTRKLEPVTSQVELFDSDITIAPGVDVRLATGHTPGSVLVVLSSGVARALLIGDVAHCPVELVDDEWAGLGDVDRDLARKTRNALARELEGTDTPIAAAHFPGLAFGRLLAGEGRRQWVVNASSTSRRNGRSR